MAYKTKYNSRKTVIGNLKFDSRKEAEYYMVLCDKKKKGEINWIKLQPEFILQRAFTLENGERVKAIKYVADFEVEYKNGYIEVIDVKGVRTRDYILKKKMLMDKYPNMNFVEV